MCIKRISISVEINFRIAKKKGRGVRGIFFRLPAKSEAFRDKYRVPTRRFVLLTGAICPRSGDSCAKKAPTRRVRQLNRNNCSRNHATARFTYYPHTFLNPNSRVVSANKRKITTRNNGRSWPALGKDCQKCI